MKLRSGTLNKVFDRLSESRVIHGFIYFSHQLFVTYLPLYHFQSANHTMHYCFFIYKHFGKKVILGLDLA